MKFKIFKDAIAKKFDEIKSSDIYRTGASKDDLWETYLDSFPVGSNPIFRERSEHDCQSCKQFIRECGNIVALIGDKVVSIWDVNIGGDYQVVSDAMSEFVKSEKIVDIFRHFERRIGTDFNIQKLDGGGILKWEHFSIELPDAIVCAKEILPRVLSDARANKDVLKRSMEEFTVDAIETTIELIEQNSLYRGEEHLNTVKMVLKHKAEFDMISREHQDNYCWSLSIKLEGAARVRNTVIGTLLSDLSSGVELDKAVKSFESKVAPVNYKRPSAVITKSMIASAQKKIEELGFSDSLSRRYATIDDITINNILFADRSAKVEMSVFDEMENEIPVNLKTFDKVEEVGIDSFVGNILPKASSVEILFENRHENNLVTLLAPKNTESPGMFKWGNNFSWSYKGDVADSIKARVKELGGNVNGVLRFSIQWNDGGNNQNDFDAHCFEPGGRHIYFPEKGIRFQSSGMLDVDIINPGRNVAVENIVYTDLCKMPEGDYLFKVHNYSHRGGKTGFKAEVAYGDDVFQYSYDKELRDSEYVEVATVNYSRTDGLKIKKSLKPSSASRIVNGISTGRFQKATIIMNSPNHWDGEETGNKHYFFILDGCLNDGKARGFFNEFLNENLREHRKVFEVLGSKMKAEESDRQLTGIGFSSTKRDHVYCKVAGSFSRIVKIIF